MFKMGELTSKGEPDGSPISLAEDQGLVTSHFIDVKEDLSEITTRYSLNVSDVRNEGHVIVGFDTEYQPVKAEFSLEDVKAGQARYEVLSYQFHAVNNLGHEWNGIIIPEKGKRISLPDFVVYALAKGVGAGQTVSRNVVLIGHFNKADIPAFEDRGKLFFHFRNIRNSLVTLGHPVQMAVTFGDSHAENLSIHLRDSILLAPAKHKSILKLGKLIGLEKITLAKNAAEEQERKGYMRLVRDYDWDLFRRYAIRDAEVCAKYFLQVVEKYKAVTGKDSFPVALSTIGMKLLLADWKQRNIDQWEVLGRETIREVVYSEKHDQFVNRVTHPYLEGIALFEQLAVECYHGGRNEQMWFGPSFIDNWNDYDLASAYPTAMAMIGMPDWRAARYTQSVSDFEPDTLGYGLVRFKFPAAVRYPTLPVRTEKGIVFPLEGQSYCCSPEIQLALALRCEIEVLHGLVIPTDPNNRPFLPFIRESIAKRNQAKDVIEKEFWKEATNSCYGKTAQGLRNKRTYNLKEKATERTHPSEITNPFYAAQITSIVRAVIGEVMNALPDHAMVFSVTTDGLITNATKAEMAKAVDGPISREFSQTRLELTGNPDVQEIKHEMKQILGWRTRGQATIQKVVGKDSVLARAGIKPPLQYEDDDSKNYFILKTFFARTPETKVEFDSPTTLREIDEFDADLVMKKTARKVSMEYDLKRKPYAVRETNVSLTDQFDPKLVNRFQHISFSTVPWRNVAEFYAARYSRDDRWRKKPTCLKTQRDFADFAEHFDTLQALGTKKASYLKKENGPLNRLVRDLCRAFKHGEAGLSGYQHLSAQQFADILNAAGLAERGLSVSRATVENGKRAGFESGTTPPTKDVLAVLDEIERKLPFLQRWVILSYPAQEGVGLLSALERHCPFVERLP